MTWFETLMGFPETSPRHVREQITVDGEHLRSRVNGNIVTHGRLETPSLRELRHRVGNSQPPLKPLSVREVIADVAALHADVANAHSLFQVASQFNLLEMAGPSITPEAGVGIYEDDHTQGPTCAVAAGAGTIYRNYFVPIHGQIGQSATHQIDCLADMGIALGNTHHRLWVMKNGYALASQAGLVEISQRLQAASEEELDDFRQHLRIGLQWETQVTIQAARHRVSQAYCAALPVDYTDHDPELWQGFARLVLEASYEATLCAAIVNCLATGNNRVYLTLVGGGVFGNRLDWIMAAIQRALTRYGDWGLDVAIVSYGASNPWVHRLIRQFSS